MILVDPANEMAKYRYEGETNPKDLKVLFNKLYLEICW